MKNSVALLIPHFNENNGLINSIKSIHCEENLDVFIIDDGSTSSKINEIEVKKNFLANGEIKFYYLKENKGIEHALNFGLKEIIKFNYIYVARLDAGDLCLGKRFEIQRLFLEKNEKIKLVGSNVRIINEEGQKLYNIIVPTDPKKIKNKLYLTSTIIHPSIMFSTDIIKKTGYYPIKFKATEDYAFYFEILKYFNASNINEFLIEKVHSKNSISVKKRKLQSLNRVKIILNNFYLGYYPVIGLFFNFLLYLAPLSFILFIKKNIFK